MEELKKNMIFTVRIDGYSSEGMGVCRVDGRAVFVPGAIPGELWEIKLLKITATAVYARGERLLEPSVSREVPKCPYFGQCGGCDTWHMSYAEELRFKRQRVNDALRRIGAQTVQVKEIIGASSVERYRNKCIFAVGQEDSSAVFGFYRERSHRIIPIERCLIQNELSERAAAAVTGFMDRHGVAPYDEQTGRGCVRHVFCRRAANTEDAVLCIVATGGFGADTGTLVDELRRACPELTGIVLNVNRTRGNTVLAGDFHTLWGRDCIRDSLCGLSFDIAPQAFYQVNPAQAEKLYRRAVDYAFSSPVSLALDLYCGAGTISLCLSRHAELVIGAEIVPEAVENARQNARNNGVTNAEFICADAAEAAEALRSRGLRPDAAVVDPPRKGMTESAISALASMTPPRIVYVSCDPATLARDILRLQSYGYSLEEVTAVDMFPRTRHVETVALLTHRDAPDG